MTLEEAFYIIGIVTMGLMLILMASLVAAVLVIKKKINNVHQMVEEKVATVATVTQAAKGIFSRIRR